MSGGASTFISAVSSEPLAQGRNRSRTAANSSTSSTGAVKPARRAAARNSPGLGEADAMSGPRGFAKACRSSRCQSKCGPGSDLRPGAMSEWPITPDAVIDQFFIIRGSRASSVVICGSEKGCDPVLSNSIPIDREFMSSLPSHSPAPACHARCSSRTICQSVPSLPIR